MQETQSVSSMGKLKKAAIAALVLVLVGAWFVYGFWAVGISARTVLMPNIPETTTYLVIGAFFGVISATRALRAGKTAKSAIQAFLGGFCVSLLFALNGYQVITYLLPSEVVNYESAYEVTYPGPSAGKYSRCEAGLWINDPNTHRRFELCTNKTDLDEQIGRGIYAVWVTARTNKLGSYIVGYTFFRKSSYQP